MHPNHVDFEYVQSALDQAKKQLADALQQLKHLHYLHDVDDADRYDEGMAQAVEGLSIVEHEIDRVVEQIKVKEDEEQSEEERL